MSPLELRATPLTGSVTPQVTAAANAFLATLSDAQKGTVQFPWTDTAQKQKQRWSNFSLRRLCVPGYGGAT